MADFKRGALKAPIILRPKRGPVAIPCLPKLFSRVAIPHPPPPLTLRSATGYLPLLNLVGGINNLLLLNKDLITWRVNLRTGMFRQEVQTLAFSYTTLNKKRLPYTSLYLKSRRCILFDTDTFGNKERETKDVFCFITERF